MFIRNDPPPLFSGNEPPTEETLLPLKSSAYRVAAAIDEVQAEVSRVSDPRILKFLKNKCRRLCAINDEYKAVLSSLRRVPLEVLAEILSAVCRPGYNTDAYYDVFAIQKGPWALSRVCRTWRQVSHTLCAEIWSTMSVWVSGYLGRRRKYPISLSRAALSDRGGHQLSLSVHDSGSMFPGLGMRRLVKLASPFSKFCYHSRNNGIRPLFTFLKGSSSFFLPFMEESLNW